MSIVTLTTDFGAADPFVGVMKGVILGRAPTARVIDLTHGIPPHDVLAGALVLRHSVAYFPRGTIHLAVVDPGVGSERRALCVETAGALLVGPDNGLLSLAAPRGEIRRIVHLTEEHFFLTPRSATFHGRDLFAPVAAALAAGTPVEKLGSEVRDMQRLDLPPVVREARALRGQVIYVDHFGNLATNVSAADLAALAIHAPSIGVGSVRLRGVATSYAAVQRGEPVAVVNSWGLLEIAVREGSARDQLGAGVGTAVVIEA
jgi:S-adenosylmethionine hydrolase